MNVTRALSILAFVVALVLAAVLEWRARRPESRLPTLGEVSEHVMSYRVGRLPVGRIAVLGFWWWVGWHFIAR